MQPIKRLFRNKSYLILCNSYGLSIGVLNVVGTLLNQMYLAHFEHGEEDAGKIGLAMIITGMIGAVTFGDYSLIYFHYGLTSKINHHYPGCGKHIKLSTESYKKNLKALCFLTRIIDESLFPEMNVYRPYDIDSSREASSDRRLIEAFVPYYLDRIFDQTQLLDAQSVHYVSIVVAAYLSEKLLVKPIEKKEVSKDEVSESNEDIFEYRNRK